MGLDVLVEILLVTGARIGEALGMCWEGLERCGVACDWDSYP
nr:MAG TPA: Integrase [Caudoviricetes sp.]